MTNRELLVELYIRVYYDSYGLFPDIREVKEALKGLYINDDLIEKKLEELKNV